MAVRLRGITKRYPERKSWGELLRRPFHRTYQEALRGVSCDVKTGEFFGLLGPNGAGKTTLFKILAHLVAPDAGRGWVLGRDLLREPRDVRKVLAPVVSNERSLYWRLTAGENLELFASLHGLDDPEGARRIRQLLETVGLADAGRKMVGEFSTGMKQRLLLARALLPDPRILLLDEPTRSLDPLAARNFRRFLRSELVERRGCTVLLATHVPEEALELCDRVGVLHEGRLLAAGRAEELAERYGDERYRLVVRGLESTGLEELARRGLVTGYGLDGVGPGGWSRAHVEVRGGEEEAAEVVRALTEEGVQVSRFERRGLSLADLIERIIEDAREGTPWER